MSQLTSTPLPSLGPLICANPDCENEVPVHHEIDDGDFGSVNVCSLCGCFSFCSESCLEGQRSRKRHEPYCNYIRRKTLQQTGGGGDVKKMYLNCFVCVRSLWVGPGASRVRRCPTCRVVAFHDGECFAQRGIHDAICHNILRRRRKMETRSIKKVEIGCSIAQLGVEGRRVKARPGKSFGKIVLELLDENGAKNYTKIHVAVGGGNVDNFATMSLEEIVGRAEGRQFDIRFE